MRSIGILLLATTVALVLTVLGCARDDPGRWLAQVEAFEAEDRSNPPQKGGIVFVGSSSIRLWDVERFFPDLAITKRGLGGSQMFDSLYYFDRIILPYEPSMLVVYAGDNDIAGRKTPKRVKDDFVRLVSRVHENLPDAKIVYLSIKPSIMRWNKVERMRSANVLIREITETDSRLAYVDIDTPMLGNDGKPRPEFFIEDGLHLSDAGYGLWAEQLRPHLVATVASR